MIQIRLATPEDNLQLQALSAAVPFETQTMSYRMVREPDYFSFGRIQGSSHRVIVAEEYGNILGTMSVIEDQVSLYRQVQKVAYTADLKLLPQARGQGIADLLMQEGVRVARESFETPLSIYTCVMKDNLVGLKKNKNLARDGHAKIQTIAEIKTYFVLPFDCRLRKQKRYDVRPLTPNEYPQLLDFWQKNSHNRHLARAYSKESGPEQLSAQGLQFFAAYNKTGDLVGSLGIWNQAHLRQVVLLKESRLQKGMRQSWNLLRKGFNLPKFPQPGQAIPIFHALHPCIAAQSPSALQELLVHSFSWVKQEGGLIVGLAFDTQDPLNLQMKPFLSSNSELWLLSDDIRFHKEQKGLFQFEIALG